MSYEKWVYLKDGKLFMHVENDGARHLRRGPEASDWEVSLDDEHLRAYPHLVADAKTLLAHREAGILDHAPLARR